MIIITQAQHFGCKIIFIEVINNDPSFLRDQIKLTANSSPDYAEITLSEEAVSLLSTITIPPLIISLLNLFLIYFIS